MMEMAADPKLSGGLDDTTETGQKISILDHLNGFQYSTEKSDNLVIDMASFSHDSNKDDINSNSRITLQRNFSRKAIRLGGGGGGGDKKINYNPSTHDRDTIVAASSARGPTMPENLSLLTVGTTNQSSSNALVHHQITITTASNMNSSSTESRCTIRRNSFKRPSFSCPIDPKRVLFFFATLSSMGTMLLIYFTLSIGKLGVDDNGLD